MGPAHVIRYRHGGFRLRGRTSLHKSKRPEMGSRSDEFSHVHLLQSSGVQVAVAKQHRLTEAHMQASLGCVRPHSVDTPLLNDDSRTCQMGMTPGLSHVKETSVHGACAISPVSALHARLESLQSAEHMASCSRQGSLLAGGGDASCAQH